MSGLRRTLAVLARRYDLPRYMWERSGARSRLGARTISAPENLTAQVGIAGLAGRLDPDSPVELSICIPTRDRLDLLIPCLASLARTRGSHSVEVLIGDTGSTAETVDVYRQLGLRYLTLPQPFNFSRACNAMAEAARGRRLLFLNNDTEAITAGWLEPLLAEPEDHVLGACLVYPGTRRIQSAGIGVMHRRGWLQRNAYGPRRGGRPRALALESLALGCTLSSLPVQRRVMAVSGAFMMLSRRGFEALGGFDEGYRVDLQDIDLCLRARARGAEVVCRGDVVFVHRHGGSRGRYAFPMDDWQRFLDRWQPELKTWIGDGPG